MKSKIGWTIVLATLFSCQKPDPQGVLVDLNGTFTKPLYLSYLKSHFEITDTAALRQDGVYYFNLKNKPYGCYKLVADSLHSFDFIYDRDTIIKINALVNDFKNATIAGSPSTNIIKEANKLAINFERDIHTLLEQWQIEDIKQLAITQKDSLFKQMETIREAYKKIGDSVMTKNDGNFANMYFMNAKTHGISLYNILDDYDFFNRVADNILKKYPDNESALGYKEQLMAIQPIVAKMNDLKIGEKMVKIEIELADSTIINLSQQNTQKKALFIQSYETSVNNKNTYTPIIQLIKQNKFEIFEVYTDSITPTQKANWIKGVLNHPKGYFDKLPMPLILLIDTNNEIMFQTSDANELKEQLPNL